MLYQINNNKLFSMIELACFLFVFIYIVWCFLQYLTSLILRLSLSRLSIYLKASWINVLMTTPWSVRYSTNAYHIIRFNALCDGWMSIQGISSFGKRNTNTCQNAATTKTPPLFFRIKVILPKSPHFFIAKMAHLIICFYSSEDTCIMCDVL